MAARRDDARANLNSGQDLPVGQSPDRGIGPYERFAGARAGGRPGRRLGRATSGERGLRRRVWHRERGVARRSGRRDGDRVDLSRRLVEVALPE